jgi:hypothetical protein
MTAEQKAVQAQTEATARAVLETALTELGCPQPAIAASRIWAIFAGHFELRARRLGSEFCPNHPYTRNPCGLCVRLDDTLEDDDA